MSQLDCEKVWASCLQDPAFLTEIPEGKPREVFHELVFQLPKVLGDRIDALVSLETVLWTKITILRHLDESGFVKQFISAYHPEHFEESGMDAETLIEEISKLFAQMLPQMEELVRDLPRFLNSIVMTEEQALADPRMGKLNDESIAAYRAGTLTIGGLLETQAMAILKNIE